MLDLSFITGAAPAAGPAGRVPHGTGPAGVTDATSFVDALAMLAALTGAPSDEAPAGDERVSMPADEWFDEPADTAARPEHAIDPMAAFAAAPLAIADSTVAPVPQDPSTDASTSPVGDTETSTPLPMTIPDVPAGATWSGAAVLEPAVGPAPTAQAIAPADARPAITVVTDDAAAQAPSTETPAVRPALSSTTAVDTPDAERLATDQYVAMSGRSVDADGRSDGTAAGERRTQAYVSRPLPIAEDAPSVAEEPAAQTHRFAAVAARSVSPDTPPVVAAPTMSSPSSSAAVASDIQYAAIGLSTNQRPSSDSGDTPAGFGFAGHAGPRLAAPTTPATPAFTSLMTSAASPDALPAETTTQIVQSIRLQMLRDGGEAHIRLDPRQFGDMTVRVKVEQGQVVARVEADAPVVREWLQSNQHVLRQSLAGQQLTLDRLDVHEPSASPDRGRREDESGRGRQQDQPRQPRRHRPEAGESFEVMA